MKRLTLLTQAFGLIIALGLTWGQARADDGYNLWLGYSRLASVSGPKPVLYCAHNHDLNLAQQELQRGLTGLLGHESACQSHIRSGTIIVGVKPNEAGFGEEGFTIRSATQNHKSVTLISAKTHIGALYGVYRYLQLMQTGADMTSLHISDAPKLNVRILDHWDNLDGSVERGYSGKSIFDWWRLPDLKDPRLTDYARANASIGINGVVVNNVNAKVDSLTPAYLKKAAAIADILRPYGIKLYLSARFSAPLEMGGLRTADPLDPAVIQWWHDKTEEIYHYIPDFGGYLVKASSEGQPGPGDYGRSHADGANMLAADVKPHGGIIMWRAFVYAAENAEDRAKQAYSAFKPLDGQFADNVMVQIKNGAIDFQPREPFHPLFGAMPHTNEMLEFQITKEYLGQATHLVYLGAQFSETLKADTYVQGAGSTVSKLIEAKLEPHSLTGMAGVANIGSDRDWSGSIFNQANWYAYGRLAWDPDSDPALIASDWVKMTLSRRPDVVAPIVKMMMTSREAVVDYMTPLGLHHQMATGHHYGPGPWVKNLARPEWNPAYYNKADKDGIGFDRTKTGSDALGQYSPAAAALWQDPHTMDEKDLLWFHHVAWDFKLKSGQTVWQGLISHYDQGVADVKDMQDTWAKLKPYIDEQRFNSVSQNLSIQAHEAKWWRDASIAYFQNVSQLPLPAGTAKPDHDLDYYEHLTFPYAPGSGH